MLYKKYASFLNNTKRTFQSYTRYCENTKKSNVSDTLHPWMSRPAPIPIANSKDRKEFEKTLKQTQTFTLPQSQPQGTLKQEKPIVETKHPDAEKEPLPSFKNNQNPETGEIGGPKGKEPTRFGDWERKGRVFDF